jgi:ABC-type multidrug transport system ATPase subunit
MIVADELCKAYRRKQVLRGMTFTARAGEITLLVGPNGAGKSTTMKVLAGLASADAGDAFVCGKSITTARLDAQRHLAFLPQAPNFHPRFTCRQIIDFYAGLRGLDQRQRDAVIAAAGLGEFIRERTGTLSGGMRQRLGMALLLLPDAPALLLDEPGLSLDPAWRRNLQMILHEEARRGKTVLITTHLIAEWNNVAHRCLFCREGTIPRELDPTNLSDDFDEMESRLEEGTARRLIDPSNAPRTLTPTMTREADEK